MYTKLSIPYLL